MTRPALPALAALCLALPAAAQEALPCRLADISLAPLALLPEPGHGAPGAALEAGTETEMIGWQDVGGETWVLLARSDDLLSSTGGWVPAARLVCAEPEGGPFPEGPELACGIAGGEPLDVLDAPGGAVAGQAQPGLRLRALLPQEGPEAGWAFVTHWPQDNRLGWAPAQVLACGPEGD